MKNLFAALAICACTLSTLAFEKTDPHFVVGEGDSQCYFVVDWYGTQKCWAFRWRSTGYAPNVFEAIIKIDHEDPRFKIAYQKMTKTYVDVYFMGYDVDDCACQWDVENCGSSSPSALIGMEDKLYYSQWWVFYQAGQRNQYGAAPIYSSWDACNSVTVANEQVYYFMIGSPDYDSSWNESPITLDESLLAFAESPFGWRVADANITTTAANFKDTANVLHRPACYMEGEWGGVVSPYNPAFKAGELLTLNGEGDYVTIEFDHKVVDDPKNPWGLDLIVFGNALIAGTKKDYYEETSDPGNWEYTGSLADEKALVEVSADGVNWFSYNDGPYCDAWAPTQGYVYDKANADTNLYSGNLWWSVTTDATWPVHPDMDASDADGLTIETLSYRYDGSAGGAAFDIGKFALPTDEKGRKYIKFVRISAYYDEDEEEWTIPEVDAVADVRPCSEYEIWKLANYTDWNTAWDTNLTGKAKIAANGLANVVNQVIGLGANESPVISKSGAEPPAPGETVDQYKFELRGVVPYELYTDLIFRSKVPLAANSGLFIKQASDLNGPWVDEIPSIQSSEADDDGCILNVLRVSNQGNFFKVAVED